MVKVELYRTGSGEIKGFLVQGHADMKDHGQDIVCAAVSILTQTVVLGLIRHLGLCPKVTRKHGYLACMLSQQADIEAESVQAIFETMAIGLGDVAGQYPEYVRIEEHRR